MATMSSIGSSQQLGAPTMKRLILKPSSLGDIIHGLQIVASLKAQQPTSHITWVVRDCFAPLVEQCTAIDRVITFERHGNLRAQFALWRQLHSEKYDEVWDMQGLLRTGLWCMACRKARKIGRPDAREGAGLFYDTCVERPQVVPAHALDVLLPFLTYAECEPTLVPLVFRQHSPSPIVQPLVAARQPRLLLFPNSRRQEKEWPHFSRLAHKLLKETQASVAWLGNTPFEGSHPKLFDLSNKTSLPDLIECMRHATLVVSNDSGPMHLAAAMGVPTVALFGPTDPRRYGPYPLKDHCVLQAPNGQLAELGAETVFGAVVAYLTKTVC